MTLGRKSFKRTMSNMTSVVLTTDILTSAAIEAYITVTGHFVTLNWDLCSCVLQTDAFPDHYTGAAIAIKHQEIIANFKVEPTKVVAIVHNQASNMELSLSILQDHHSIESIPLFWSLPTTVLEGSTFNFCYRSASWSCT